MKPINRELQKQRQAFIDKLEAQPFNEGFNPKLSSLTIDMSTKGESKRIFSYNDNQVFTVKQTQEGITTDWHVTDDMIENMHDILYDDRLSNDKIMAYDDSMSMQ